VVARGVRVVARVGVVGRVPVTTREHAPPGWCHRVPPGRVVRVVGRVPPRATGARAMKSNQRVPIVPDRVPWRGAVTGVIGARGARSIVACRGWRRRVPWSQSRVP